MSMMRTIFGVLVDAQKHGRETLLYLASDRELSGKIVAVSNNCVRVRIEGTCNTVEYTVRIADIAYVGEQMPVTAEQAEAREERKDATAKATQLMKRILGVPEEPAPPKAKA